MFASAYASLAEGYLALALYVPSQQAELTTKAEDASLKALELDNSLSAAHVWYADLLTILGRVTEAEVETRRGEELDPVSLEVYAAATIPLYYGRHYDQLIEHCQGWVKRNPNAEWNYHHCLGAIYVQTVGPRRPLPNFERRLSPRPCMSTQPRSWPTRWP